MKIRFSIILLLSLFLCSTSIALASPITPNYIPPEWEYQESRRYFNEKWGFEHEARNGKNVNDNVSYSASRELSASLSVKGSVEAGVILSKVGIETEVSFGISTTKTTTVDFTIPANTITLCKYGSAFVNTNGYLNYYFNGKLSSSQYVFGDWSYRSVSDSYVIQKNYYGPNI